MDTTFMDTKRGASSNKAPYAALPEVQIERCLKQCAAMAQDYLQEVYGNFWHEWIASIEKRIEHAYSNKEQVELAELVKRLQGGASASLQQMQQYLNQGFVDFSRQQLNVASGQERFKQNIGLSLVDNAELEETIAITSISHRADSQFAEVLWALHQRLALLQGGDKIDERSNPVSPIQFCDNVRRVLQELKLDARTKVLGYKKFEQTVIQPLAQLYQNLNELLIAEGVLPNLRYVVGGTDGAEASSAVELEAAEEAVETTDTKHETEPQAEPEPVNRGRRATDKLIQHSSGSDPQSYQQGLVSAIRLLQTHLGFAPAATAVAAPTGAGQNMPGGHIAARSDAAHNSGSGTVDVVGAVQTLQAQMAAPSHHLQSAATGHLQPLQVAEFSQQLTAELGKQGEPRILDDDMNTIELVGLVFAYILNEEQLPDSVKALLSYLHTPLLKLAFIDPDFFDNAEHPARLLLNQMAEAGSRWVGNDGSSQYNMLEKIKTTVFHVLQHFVNDVKVFAEALVEFSSYARNVARRQELMEKRALEKARGEEKLREAKIRVNSDISACIDGKALPSPVLLLLLLPWSDYLSFIVLRYGADSDNYRQALDVANQLLWSVEPKLLEVDRVKQLDLQNGLLQTLRSGFETIGYEQNKSRKLIDAVSSLQRLALKSQQVEPAPDTMRAKLEKMAADKAGQIKPEERKVTPEESQIIEKLKLIEFGTWLENDKGQRIKVAWYNHKTMHYMLVDQQGRKVSMSSALQLAREMIAGRLRVIAGSAKPFFERALENIYHSLNARASGELLERE